MPERLELGKYLAELTRGYFDFWGWKLRSSTILKPSAVSSNWQRLGGELDIEDLKNRTLVASTSRKFLAGMFPLFNVQQENLLDNRFAVVPDIPHLSTHRPELHLRRNLI